MRKNLIAVAVLLAMSLVAMPALAQSENAYSKSTGGVGYEGLGAIAMGAQARAMFVAMGTPADAKGRINAINQGGVDNVASFKGVVECYNPADTNRAIFSGRITQFDAVSEGATNTQYFRAAVLDAGEPGSVGDLIQIQRSDSEFDCEEEYMPARPVTNGNLQVHHDNAQGS